MIGVKLERSESEVWRHDGLECPRKRHICVVVRAIGAETELASCLSDTGSESLICVGKTEGTILGYEGTVGCSRRVECSRGRRMRGGGP